METILSHINVVTTAMKANMSIIMKKIDDIQRSLGRHKLDVSDKLHDIIESVHESF